MRRIVYLVVAIFGIALIWLVMRPHPVPVDLAVAARGSMLLTVHDDGKTRIREKYIVSTPVAGRLIRVDLKPGDPVIAGETQLSVIEPTDPTLLDPRALAEARAREQAAAARTKQLEPRLKLAQDRLNFAETEMSRVRQMFQKNAASQQQLDQSILAFDAAKAEYSDVVFAGEIAEYELKLSRAAMFHSGEQPADAAPAAFRLPIMSPITGKVLRVMQESATIVAAGAPLLELGDPADLEVEVDVLSTDAVRIQPGATAFLEHWGGETPIPARVRLVEPSAFTKISALGIEEQRVNVILDFDQKSQQPTKESTLGDGFRVEARIVIWEGQDVLMIPAGALFRSENEWAVFRNVNDTAQTTTVRVGHRNDTHAEILDGLEPGAEVIVHPGDQLRNGVLIRKREL